MSSNNRNIPPMATALQNAGYRQQPYLQDNPTPTSTNNIRIVTMNENATIPTRGSEEAAGLDFYSSEPKLILPQQQQTISTSIKMEIPKGYYGQLFSRSGLCKKNGINVGAGVIDSDYRGEIKIILFNNSNKPYPIKTGDKIAQMVILPTPTMHLEVTESLHTSDRGTKGFGSTDKTIPSNNNKNIANNNKSQSKQPNTAAAATLQSNNIEDNINDIIPPCNIELSSDPFDDAENIELDIRGNHPTLGLLIEESQHWDNKVFIYGAAPSTPPRRIKNWTNRIKNTFLHKINNIIIKSPTQAREIIKTIRDKGNTTLTITVSVDDKRPIQHEDGIPLLYYDQLSHIANLLHDIKYDTTTIPHQNNHDTTTNNANSRIATIFKMIKSYAQHGNINITKGILPKKQRRGHRLTRRKCKNDINWPEWQKSEHKQLDQYENQKMFGKPCPLPPGANVLDLLWTYLIKDDGRLKARCVCNGKHYKKNDIFGYTYAKMLDHSAERIFWATTATKNFIVRGADASNAFAEAGPPKIPLYIRVDTPYKEWYKAKYNKSFPDDYVLPVQRALQGHPESSRSWAILIDKILRNKLKLKPTRHEPCLYHGYYKNKEILFLR